MLDDAGMNHDVPIGRQQPVETSNHLRRDRSDPGRIRPADSKDRVPATISRRTERGLEQVPHR